MPTLRTLTWPWGAAALVLAVLGSAVLWRVDDAARREAFDTQARIAHRLLSQRAVQLEAILATLTLLPPATGGDDAARRLPALLPQVREVLRRDGAARWERPDLDAAEAASRRLRRAVVAAVDPGRAEAWLLLAGTPSSFALAVDLRQALREPDWPVAEGSAVGVQLLQTDAPAVPLQPGRAVATELGRYRAAKLLAAESQPWQVVLEQPWGWADLPWGRWTAWWTLCAAASGLAAAWWRQRSARRRAEEWLRLGQVTRLNTLGELAAGMAHELNQPLTAVLANTQAAARLLAEEPPELDTARQAMTQASAQARRASEVLARLRRALQRPDEGEAAVTLSLEAVAREALHLLAPDCAQLGLQPKVLVAASAAPVRADAVALEQILHNLLRNALQSLAEVPAARRSLSLDIEADARQGHLTVRDSGEGIAPEIAARLFEPFASTREGGLGLGLSLSESLAQAQGGALVLLPGEGPGAAFRLSLPRAEGA